MLLLLYFAWRYHRYRKLNIAESISVTTAVDEAKSGDLVLFHAQDTSIPRAIFMGSPWTHVGIVHCNGTGKYILELNMRKDKGISYKSMEKRIVEYNVCSGVMAIRSLDPPLRTEQQEAMDRIIQEIRTSTHGVHSITRFTWTAFQRTLLRRHRYKWTLQWHKLSCSLFVARILFAIGVIYTFPFFIAPADLANPFSMSLYYTNGFMHGAPRLVQSNFLSSI